MNSKGFMERNDWTKQKSIDKIDLSNNVCFDRVFMRKIMDEEDSNSIIGSLSYPDENEIYKTICEYYRLDMKKVAIGFGSTELIQRILYTLRDKKIKILSPTFEMVKIYASILNMEYSEESFVGFDSIDIEKLTNNEVLYIANPNGNNGHSFNTDQIEYLLETNGFVIIDEAYIDYSSNQSSFYLTNKHKNFCVLRTFSKSLGFAGIRCGFCYGQKDFIQSIQDIRMNYVSCGITSYMLKKYINEMDFIVDRMKSSKKYLSTKYNVLNKHGNFICINEGVEDFNWCKSKKMDGYTRITLTNEDVFRMYLRNEYNLP